MLKLVTFNIRCDYDQDGANSFRFRKPVILKKLAEEKPDVICFQEVLPHVAAWLKENLTEYTVIGCGRSETLEETFWLSPTPYVPASRYEEQSICPRVCTEVVLEDLQEKKVFRLCDIHLDHLGVQARTLGLSQILKKMDDAVLFANAPVILAGDFNAEPDGEEFAVMRERTDYVNYTEGIGITYHGFEPEDEPERIDYIYIKKAKEGYAGLTCRSVKKWEDRDKEVWLSDHYPICAELEWINL